jgi:hypothetical protein
MGLITQLSHWLCENERLSRAAAGGQATLGTKWAFGALRHAGAGLSLAILIRL